MMVALSIIIPTYNRLWALPKAIESCRAIQSPHEIIVVDDGSRDGTSDWLAQQPDLVHFRTENWGKDWAVNKAFAVAKGDYVRFLDSDDWLEPGASDAQLEIARREDADIVVAGYRTHNDTNGQGVTEPWVRCDDFVAQQLGEIQPSHYSAFIFRRSFIADVPHRAEFGANDDRMFILEVARREPKQAIYDGIAFVHRHHGRGRLQVAQSLGAVALDLAELALYRKYMTLLEVSGQLTARRKKAPTRTRLWPLAHTLARIDPRAAADLVRWIYELDPNFVIPGSGAVPTLYRTLGFEMTTRILNFRRYLLGR